MVFGRNRMFTDSHDYVYHVTMAMRMCDPDSLVLLFSPDCLVVLKTQTILFLLIQLEFCSTNRQLAFVHRRSR